jgi:hypothetical protein
MSVRRCDRRLLGIVSAYAAEFHLTQEVLDPCLFGATIVDLGQGL